MTTKLFTAEDYFERASARHTRGDLDVAIADYSEVIRLNPHHISAHNNRGNVRCALTTIVSRSTTTAAMNAKPKAIWMARWPITPNRFGWIPKTLTAITTAA